MSSFTFDVETDGLLDHLTEIKCLNVINNETGEQFRFTDYEFYLDAYTGEKTNVPTPRTGSILDGLVLLAGAGEIAGHNIEGFDLLAIEKVYPSFRSKATRFDTAAASRLIYTDIKDRDSTATRKGKFTLPGNLFGTHKLAAWGIRLGGRKKTDFNPKDFGWTWNDYPFSKECDDYCMDDVLLNVDVVEHFRKRLNETGVPHGALELEQSVARILQRQMTFGWLYDVKAAQELTKELQKEKLDLEDQLREAFADFFKRDGGRLTYPKRTMKRFVVNDLGGVTRKYKGEEQRGWFEYIEQGAAHQKVKLVSFNPGSRDQIADRMMKLFGWEPEEFTPKGSPKVDETTLGKLPYPEAQLCAEYLTVDKKLGQVADGKAAQLKKVDADGRMRGYVNHNGAVTGRMTHSGPNVAQTDKDPRVRALYIVPPGKKLVGCDADGLEGCCLGHYLARYDNGAYIGVILEGDKSKGTDLHSRNRDAVGMQSRDNAKTIFYAWMYGAGDYKLGTVMYDDWDDEKKARFNSRYQGEKRKQRLVLIGRKARAKLVAGIDGMQSLIKLVKDKSKNPGFVRGLDGRRVLCRSQHAALNTLLQSAGALIMKKALVLLDESLQAHGFTPGKEYEFVGNIHDELQMEVEEQHAVFVGKQAAKAIVNAGLFFEFRTPLAGSYDVGDNWSETH